MGGLSAGEGQSGCAGGGRDDARAVRRGSEGQSVPDLESAVVGVLLSATGEGCGATETPWQWDENPWHTDDCGQNRPDGGARRLEAKVEPIFHPYSYGYRPRRSALDAV